MSAYPPYPDPVSAFRPGGADQQQPVREAELAIAASLSAHGPREGAALEEYRTLMEQCDDAGIRYLAGLILDDEERHHRQINEMLHQIQSFLWETEVEPRVPYLTVRDDPDLHAATERLLEIEHEDAAELRNLRRQVRSQPSSSLLPLLVELMLLDTAKHIEILKLIKRHTKR